MGVPSLRTTHRNPRSHPTSSAGDAASLSRLAGQRTFRDVSRRLNVRPEDDGESARRKRVPASQGGRHFLPERDLRRRLVLRRRFGVTRSRADPRRRARSNPPPCRPHRENATRRKPSRTCSWVRAPARRVPHHPTRRFFHITATSGGARIRASLESEETFSSLTIPSTRPAQDHLHAVEAAASPRDPISATRRTPSISTSPPTFAEATTSDRSSPPPPPRRTPRAPVYDHPRRNRNRRVPPPRESQHFRLGGDGGEASRDEIARNERDLRAALRLNDLTTTASRGRAPDGNPDDEPYRRLAAMVTAAREGPARPRGEGGVGVGVASEVPGRRLRRPSPPPNPPGSRSPSLPSSPFLLFAAGTRSVARVAFAPGHSGGDGGAPSIFPRRRRVLRSATSANPSKHLLAST